MAMSSVRPFVCRQSRASAYVAVNGWLATDVRVLRTLDLWTVIRRRCFNPWIYCIHMKVLHRNVTNAAIYTVSQKKVAHHTLRNIFAQG